jgi:serine protease Do
MRRFISFGPALVVLLTIGVVLLAVPAAVRRITAADTSAKIVLAQRSMDDDDILERINTATRAVADSVRPSVVHIEVSSGRRFAARSTGSGWVFDDDGHIITNAHVVRGAERVSVQFSDGRVVQAEKVRGEVFLADPYTDVAVIKVPRDPGVFAIKRATGIQPRQGDSVFAFGSPFGFKFSMSRGIISGLGRDPSAAVEFGGFTNFIQTDAAVNPGNSGGPLVDVKGRVIGMSVAIATGRNSDGATDENGGDSAGISFAIPLGTIESVVSQLLEKGQVSRGMLGIQFEREPREVRGEDGSYGLGVGIDWVSEEGPAFGAGLRAGDVITSIDDQQVREPSQLRSLIGSRLPGQEVKFKAWREGRVKELSARLIEYPRNDILNLGAFGAMRRFGMELDRRRDRAVVIWVGEDSQAARAGFARGQTIKKVGEMEVNSAQTTYIALGDQGLLLGKRIAVEIEESDEAAGTKLKAIRIQLLR